MYNHQRNKKLFFEHGWCRFESDDSILRWVKSALLCARSTVVDNENAQWLRYGGTWFAGVNVFPNRADGSIPGGPLLAGEAIDFIHKVLSYPTLSWDRAQVSVCYPGYPQPMASESEAVFRFRRDHDAAHIDGFLREGPQRRRYVREHHGFILGIPMVEFDEGASPLVVWEGSHEMVRSAMKQRLEGLPAIQWSDEDITETYHAVRKRIFEKCRRVKLLAKPGETYLVHRLALHGISPWSGGAKAGEDGRMVCYFRPDIGSVERWLLDP